MIDDPLVYAEARALYRAMMLAHLRYSGAWPAPALERRYYRRAVQIARERLGRPARPPKPRPASRRQPQQERADDPVPPPRKSPWEP